MLSPIRTQTRAVLDAALDATHADLRAWAATQHSNRSIHGPLSQLAQALVEMALEVRTFLDGDTDYEFSQSDFSVSYTDAHGETRDQLLQPGGTPTMIYVRWYCPHGPPTDFQIIVMSTGLDPVELSLTMFESRTLFDTGHPIANVTMPDAAEALRYITEQICARIARWKFKWFGYAREADRLAAAHRALQSPPR